jgi:hypothetical protein
MKFKENRKKIEGRNKFDLQTNHLNFANFCRVSIVSLPVFINIL